MARAREPFAIPSESSARAAWWIAGFRVLTLPPLLFGREHRFEAEVEGRTVRIACIGFPRRFDALLKEIFGAIALVGRGSVRASWRPLSLSRLDADLIAVDVHRVFLGGFSRSGWLIVPEEVRWRGGLEELPPSSPTESLRSDIRKVERLGYRLEEAGSPSDWEEFFESMVVPHLVARFGENAKLPGRAARKTLRRRGTLLFIGREGVREGGACLLRTPRGVLLRRLGIRDGDPGLLREGVLTALYLGLFEWSRERGYREFDAGTTLPLPRQGLARYKAKLGLEPAPSPIALTAAFHFDHEDAALASCFRRSPLLHEVDGRVETYP
ncbi:MAG: hypothetical protein ACC682_14335 [Gemmatimonadota bacterium]